jgi:predicted lipase
MYEPPFQQYNFAEGQARNDFPGRVHQGIYRAYTLIVQDIMAEVARLRPSHVFVTGHSLGGALSHLIAYTIADRYPEITVDAVAFASVMMADDGLMTAIRAKVNLRNVFYLGRGQDGHLYRVGDLIPQATW